MNDLLAVRQLPPEATTHQQLLYAVVVAVVVVVAVGRLVVGDSSLRHNAIDGKSRDTNKQSCSHFIFFKSY